MCSQLKRDGSIPTDLTDGHWFEKTNERSGSHYGLRCVKTRLYLSINSAEDVFCLDANNVYLFRDESKTVCLTKVFLYFIYFLCAILHLLLHVLNTFPHNASLLFTLAFGGL